MDEAKSGGQPVPQPALSAPSWVRISTFENGKGLTSGSLFAYVERGVVTYQEQSPGGARDLYLSVHIRTDSIDPGPVFKGGWRIAVPAGATNPASCVTTYNGLCVMELETFAAPSQPAECSGIGGTTDHGRIDSNCQLVLSLGTTGLAVAGGGGGTVLVLYQPPGDGPPVPFRVNVEAGGPPDP